MEIVDFFIINRKVVVMVVVVCVCERERFISRKYWSRKPV